MHVDIQSYGPMTTFGDPVDRRGSGFPGARSAQARFGRSAALASVLLFAMAGCTAAGEDVLPPPNKLFFPTSLALSPDESVLFVGSSNADLSYSSGAVSVISLAEVEALLGPWLADKQISSQDCSQDLTDTGLLECNASTVIQADAGVRVGNFSSGLAVQELESGDLRLFLAVRGDPSITWIDYSAATGELTCADSALDMPLCSESYRLRNLRNDPDLPSLISEPFEVYVDSLNGYALVTHQSGAAVSLIDAPTDGSAPVLSDALAGLFLPNPNTGARAAIGVAGRLPGSGDDLVYVTSRTESRVQMLYVQRVVGGPRLVISEFFFLNGVLGDGGVDSRGIAFGAGGDRAYVVNRTPPLLHIVDTSLGADGFPRNQPLSFVELCRDPSNVQVADMGRGERAYVTCFSSGQVWVVDPVANWVEAVIDVGRGPHAVAIAPERKRLYVTNYLEDTISVVDLTPGTATENRAVLRIGRTRQSGGDR